MLRCRKINQRARERKISVIDDMYVAVGKKNEHGPLRPQDNLSLSNTHNVVRQSENFDTHRHLHTTEG